MLNPKKSSVQNVFDDIVSFLIARENATIKTEHKDD